MATAESLLISMLEQGRPPGGAMATARLFFAGLQSPREGDDGQNARAQRQREATTTSARFALFADALWTERGVVSESAVLDDAFAALQDSTAGAAEQSIAEQAAQRQGGGGPPPWCP